MAGFGGFDTWKEKIGIIEFMAGWTTEIKSSKDRERGW